MAEAERIKYSDWEQRDLKNYLRMNAFPGGEGGYQPPTWAQRLFPEYGPTGGEGGTFSWDPNRFTTDAGGTAFYDVADLAQRLKSVGGYSGIGYDPQKSLVDMQRYTGNNGYYVPDAQGYMYVPKIQESGGLFKQGFEVFKPIAMTAGIGMGLNALAGAAGLANAGVAAGGASAGSSAAAGGASAAGGAAAGGGIGLGSGITPGMTASGIGGGAIGSGITPAITASGIGGGGLGTGIGLGAGGAGALSAAGATGLGALSSGYFGAESLYPVVGGSSAGALAGASTAPGVVPATNAFSSAIPAALSNPSVMGALAGGLLGGIGGGSEPAGTTTTEEGVPDWLMPYVKPTLDKYSTTVQNYNTDPYGVMPSAMQEFQKTLQGNYLDPSTNKWLEQYYKLGAERIKGTIAPSFGHMQAFGSHSGYNEALSRGLADFSVGLYGGNYQKERDRQSQMTALAPSFLTGASQSAFAPYQGYLNTVGSLGKKTQQPYFQGSDMQNVLGGAAMGWGLGNLFKS
jgi:hypothetical protein